jgi:hypothetical protein
MSDVSKGVTSKDGLADDPRWALVQRIISSRGFAKAVQLRDIVLYVSRRALEDQPKAITEQEVASNALGRGANFNPNEDNIVRAQVRHVRQRLEEYFSTEGQNEPLVLLIPKGTYVPQFEHRAAHRQKLAGERDEPAGADGLTSPRRSPGMDSANTKLPRRWLLIGLLSVLLAAAGGVSLTMRRQNKDLRRVAASSQKLPRAHAHALLSRIFVPDNETSIVLADPAFGVVQGFVGREIPIEDYASGAYPDNLLETIRDRSAQSALRSIAGREVTSFTDAILAERLMEACRLYNGKCRIRYPRYLNSRDFRTGNFILLGSRQSNAWDGLFENQLNFYFEMDAKTRLFRIRNRSPLPGELNYYATYPAEMAPGDSYGYLALLPNLTGTGSVLIISGIRREDTEAVGELIMSDDFSTTLSEIGRTTPGGNPSPYVQVLLRSQLVAGTSQALKIVASRVIRSVQP